MNNVELGKRIKLLRKNRDMKQQDLADALSVSRGQISNLESGRRGLSLPQLEKLCSLFRVDMEYFGISPTAEESISLIERAKLLFESNEVSKDVKENLYLSLMQIYLNSK
jgi:transcriptional regulator with XRE-family HTH domain